MEMPKPSGHHRKYEAFVGTWKGEEVLHPMPWSPRSAKATSNSTARLELDNYFLIMDYVQLGDGQVAFRAHQG